jgi:hypothetical protein
MRSLSLGCFMPELEASQLLYVKKSLWRCNAQAGWWAGATGALTLLAQLAVAVGGADKFHGFVPQCIDCCPAGVAFKAYRFHLPQPRASLPTRLSMMSSGAPQVC